MTWIPWGFRSAYRQHLHTTNSKQDKSYKSDCLTDLRSYLRLYSFDDSRMSRLGAIGPKELSSQYVEVSALEPIHDFRLVLHFRFP